MRRNEEKARGKVTEGGWTYAFGFNVSFGEEEHKEWSK